MRRPSAGSLAERAISPWLSPVDRGFLAKLLQTLQEREVKIIGLDVLFDQPTEPEKDDLLKDTIANLKVPLFVSYTDSTAIVDQTQLQHLNDFLPRRVRARAELTADPVDGVVRWILTGAGN